MPPSHLPAIWSPRKPVSPDHQHCRQHAFIRPAFRESRALKVPANRSVRHAIRSLHRSRGGKFPSVSLYSAVEAPAQIAPGPAAQSLRPASARPWHFPVRPPLPPAQARPPSLRGHRFRNVQGCALANIRLCPTASYSLQMDRNSRRFNAISCTSWSNVPDGLRPQAPESRFQEEHPRLLDIPPKIA